MITGPDNRNDHKHTFDFINIGEHLHKTEILFFATLICVVNDNVETDDTLVLVVYNYRPAREGS